MPDDSDENREIYAFLLIVDARLNDFLTSLSSYEPSRAYSIKPDIPPQRRSNRGGRETQNEYSEY